MVISLVLGCRISQSTSEQSCSRFFIFYFLCSLPSLKCIYDFIPQAFTDGWSKISFIDCLYWLPQCTSISFWEKIAFTVKHLMEV